MAIYIIKAEVEVREGWKGNRNAAKIKSLLDRLNRGIRTRLTPVDGKPFSGGTYFAKLRNIEIIETKSIKIRKVK